MGDATSTRDGHQQTDLGIFAEVVARIEAGESVNAIFAERPAKYPHVTTWWRAIAKDENLRNAYQAAVRARAERYAEEIVDIADNVGLAPIVGRDGKIAMDENGDVIMGVTRETIDHARLRADVRKWNASKLMPKVYGERQTIAGDADNPIAIDDLRASIAVKLAAKPAE